LMDNVSGLLALRTAAAAVIGLTALGPAHAETEAAAIWRQSVAISVALAPGQPARYAVRGELCATDDEHYDGRARAGFRSIAGCHLILFVEQARVI
jgi:hypothetical protein